MSDEARLKKVVENIVGLPTLPSVVSHVSELMQNPKVSAADVGKVIANDQALASKVLKMVNSAFYGFPRRITTVSHAIVVLGFSTVRNVVLSASVFDAFQDEQTSKFDREGFWMHCIACGVAAKVIARRMGIKNIEEAFIAGILHDIGKVIMDQFMQEDFCKILDVVEQEDCLIIEAEKKVLNFTHQDIGRWLGEKWKLPAALVEVIAYHHHPEQAEEGKEMVSIVHVADVLIRAMELGNGGDQKIPAISPECWEACDLSLLSLDKVFDEIEEEMSKATIFMDLVG